MKTAIVTGASSGIGEAIVVRLLAQGYRVIGISRSISATDFAEEAFTPYCCDLSDINSIAKLVTDLKKEDPSLLINAAGAGIFAPHEEIAFHDIAKLTTLNLTAPMLLSHALLRKLKNNGGYIININSIEALRASKFAALYSATKAGLKAFGDALFEETRKSRLSITNINPDMTQSSFYEHLRFEPTNKEDEKLFASDIADAVEHILTMRKGAVVTDYTIRSLHFGIAKKQ